MLRYRILIESVIPTSNGRTLHFTVIPPSNGCTLELVFGGRNNTVIQFKEGIVSLELCALQLPIAVLLHYLEHVSYTSPVRTCFCLNQASVYGHKSIKTIIYLIKKGRFDIIVVAMFDTERGIVNFVYSWEVRAA